HHRDPPSFPTRPSSDLRMHCTGENPNIEAIVAIDGPRVSVDVIENGVTATPLNRPCKKISTGLLCVSVLGETRYEMYPTFVVSRSEEHTSELQSRENLV